MNSRQNVIHVVDDDASFRKAMYVVLHESEVQALETIIARCADVRPKWD
jgi:FixJ family two-component response regulator